jgi:hypothetical protein
VNATDKEHNVWLHFSGIISTNICSLLEQLLQALLYLVEEIHNKQNLKWG